MVIGPGVLTPDVPVGAVAAAQRHADALALVRARSVAAVDALVKVLSPGRLDYTYTAAEPAAVAALAGAWRTAAASSASVAGDAAAAWGADPAGGLSTVPAPPPGLLPDAAGTAAQLRLTVLIEAKQRIAAGTGPEEALEHARQRAGRGAAGIGARAARTAHERTLQAAGIGWARIPATNGCPWCLLLASRGPVYTSQRTAQGNVGPYHPWCRCRTLAVPRGTPLAGYLDPGSDVGALVDQAAAAWRATGTMDRYTASPFARDQERTRRGRTGPARPRPAADPAPAPAAPRLSDTDQARLNTANREANRLNAQAYRLQQEGRTAEAAALREQAAIHRAEAERITDTLRTDAARPPASLSNPFGVAPKPIRAHQALTGTNPGYLTGQPEYRSNCTRTVVAYEARRRGIDVQAAPLASEDITIEDLANETFELPPGTTAHVWRATGSLTATDAAVAGSPVGSRHWVCVTWPNKEKSSHIFMAENRSGVAVLIDPQSGTEPYEPGPIAPASAWLLRVDHLDFAASAPQFTIKL